MFIPLLLVCSIETNVCKAFTSGRVHSTEEQCMEDLREGLNYIGEGYVLKGVDCYYWGISA